MKVNKFFNIDGIWLFKWIFEYWIEWNYSMLWSFMHSNTSGYSEDLEIKIERLTEFNETGVKRCGWVEGSLEI